LFRLKKDIEVSTGYQQENERVKKDIKRIEEALEHLKEDRKLLALK